MNAVVFAGPTIAARDVAGVVDAVCLPPAAQGDVYRVALEHPRAIGLIDGYFERQPAVWHKEILWAMSRGIAVFGSASMGALRAAELAAFGMVGVGAIFEAYRDGSIEDDDEVAVIHGPADTGYRPGSDAMVNIRATLGRAREAGVLDAAASAMLERLAKRLFYAKRSYARILEGGQDAGVPAEVIERFSRWLPEGAVNQKRDDAVAMLGAMRHWLDAGHGAGPVDFVFEDSLWWDALQSTAAGDALAREDAEVIEALGRDPAARDRAVAGAMGWWLAAQDAVRHGETCTAAEMLDQASALCRQHTLSDAAAVDRWLAENRCSRAELERLFDARAHAARASGRAGDRLLPMLLGYLRWTGEYAQLLARRDPLTRR